MTAIFLVLGLIWVATIVLFWAGSTWLQGYMYSEPAEGMPWRAAAAGTAITAVLALWCLFDYRSPGSFPAVFQFSASSEKSYDELWIINKDGKKVHYRAGRDASGKDQYRDDTNRLMPSRPQAVLVMEEGEEIRFEPERDSQGKFRVAQGESLVYTDPQGRSMDEQHIGTVKISRPGLLIGNLFLNLLLFGVLFAGLWLVLRFQWSHSLGIALACWIAIAILIVPMLTSKVEDAARQQPTSTQLHEPFVRGTSG